MRTYYSHTQLDTFRKCPLKYKFKYVDCRRVALEGVEAFLGSRVHEVLKELYLDLSRYREDHRALLLFYERRWDEEWHAGVHIVKRSMTADDYFELGEECINTFRERNYPFNHDRTAALEYWVEFALGQKGERWFRGRVDRLASRADGTYEIHDYKTGRLPPDFRPEKDAQLSLYQVAAQSMHPEARPTELVWHFLQYGECFRLRRAESDLVQIVNETNRFIDEVESETRFPAHPGRLCDWCEFREICPERG